MKNAKELREIAITARAEEKQTKFARAEKLIDEVIIPRAEEQARKGGNACTVSMDVELRDHVAFVLKQGGYKVSRVGWKSLCIEW